MSIDIPITNDEVADFVLSEPKISLDVITQNILHSDPPTLSAASRSQVRHYALMGAHAASIAHGQDSIASSMRLVFPFEGNSMFYAARKFASIGMSVAATLAAFDGDFMSALSTYSASALTAIYGIAPDELGRYNYLFKRTLINVDSVEDAFLVGAHEQAHAIQHRVMGRVGYKNDSIKEALAFVTTDEVAATLGDSSVIATRLSDRSYELRGAYNFVIDKTGLPVRSDLDSSYNFVKSTWPEKRLRIYGSGAAASELLQQQHSRRDILKTGFVELSRRS